MKEESIKLPRIKGIKQLYEFMQNLKPYIDNVPICGLSEVHFYWTHRGLENMAYFKDIKELIDCLDYAFRYTSYSIGLRITSVSRFIDGALFEHEMRKAPKEIQNQYKSFTEYMKLTDRQLIQLKEMIYDLFQYSTEFYALNASLLALYKKTNIKEFLHISDVFLHLKPTEIDINTWTYEAAKKHCKQSKDYLIEDYLNTILLGMQELKKIGIDLKITPFKVEDYRPSEETIDRIIKSRHFMNKTAHLAKQSQLLYRCHEYYLAQMSKPFDSFFNEAMSWYETVKKQQLSEE